MRGVRFVTSMGSRLEILEQPFSVIRVIFRVTPPAFSCVFMQFQCHKRISDCICLDSRKEPLKKKVCKKSANGDKIELISQEADFLWQ